MLNVTYLQTDFLVFFCARHAWLLGSVYRGSGHRGSKARGVLHSPGSTHNSVSSVGATQGPDSHSLSQNLPRKSHLTSSSTSNLLAKTTVHGSFSSSKVSLASASSCLSSSYSGDNQYHRLSNTTCTRLSTNNVDNGNIGEHPQIENKNFEHEQDNGGLGLRGDDSCRNQSSGAASRSRLPSSSSSSAIHSKLPVYRVVKGITNSNQLFHYRFSPV